MQTTAETFAPQAYQQWERRLVLAILFYMVAQNCFPFLEKYTLWGEFFVFFSAFAILKLPYTSTVYHNRFLFMMWVWVLLFPVYGIFIAKMNWEKEFNVVFLARHLVFFYYAVFFFFSFKYADLIVQYLKKYGVLLLIFIPVFNIFFGSNAVGFSALYGLLLMGVSQRFPGKRAYFFALSLIIFIFLVGIEGGTGKVDLGFLLGFIALNAVASVWTKFIPSVVSRIFLWGLFAAGLILGFQFISRFYALTSQMAAMGDSISSLAAVSQDLGTDLSGLWRPVLWSHLYGRFLKHPWGVGLGTPLFERWLDGFVMLHLYKPGENYVQGAHNSFITLVARLGIPALIFFSFMFFSASKLAKTVLKRLEFHPFKTKEGRLLSGALLGFLFIIVGASFNVALESPLYAGAFWFSFGLFARLFGDAAWQ